jgi:predicted dehydrogenase
VATPPAAHLELVLAALHAGKDVLVEKPAFLRASDFDAVAAAAARAGRQVLVTENYFYKPLRRKLSELVGAGAVGDVLFVSVNALKRQPSPGWRADPAVSGGPLLEGGVHWVNLMSNLGLEVRAVRGQAIGEVGASFLVAFEYAQGAAGVLQYSWETYTRLGGLRLSHVYGTTGAITFESNGGLALTRGPRRTLWMPPPTQASGTLPMLADFVHALRTGSPAEFTLALARRDVELARRAQAPPTAPGGR